MQIKMSGEQATTQEMAPTCMESVNRICKLPVVESTVQTATQLYGKVKDYNSVTNWTLQTAENTVNMAVEVGKPLAKPVVEKLEGPIKKVDGMLCTGLDYVEDKVPSVKLPPTEIYTTTKDYVGNTITPAVESARAYVDPAVQTAKHYVDPAVQTAYNVMEPVVEKARNIADPLVQPVLEKAQQLKDYGTHKVEEFINKKQDEEIECQDCKDNSEQH